MTLPAPQIHAVAIPESEREAVVRLVSEAFGGEASIVERASVERALSDPPVGERCLLLLGQPTDASAAAALDAKDAFGLPLWGVVAIGPRESARGLPAIPADELGTGAARELLRLAAAQHECERRRQEARGDMLSFSTRICHDLRSPLGVLQASIHLLAQPDLSAQVQRSEIAQPALDSLRKQSRLVSHVSAFADAVGNTVEPERVDMETAFAAGHDRCRQAVELKGARVEARGDWLDAMGVASWIELMWELAITSALDRHDRGDVLEAGCRESGAGENEYFIRFEQIPTDEPARPMKILPFNLVHMDRNSRDIGLPMAQRFARLQGGRVGARVSGPGLAEFYFTLPAAPR